MLCLSLDSISSASSRLVAINLILMFWRVVTVHVYVHPYQMRLSFPYTVVKVSESVLGASRRRSVLMVLRTVHTSG